jgi:flagellar protein FliO/FliZ
LGLDLTSYLKFVAALIFVLALIGVIALIARRIGVPGTLRPLRGRRRLEIQEILPLDPKRRLILVRRDDREHLLLLGAGQDLVVETGIPVAPDIKSGTGSITSSERPSPIAEPS